MTRSLSPLVFATATLVLTATLSGAAATADTGDTAANTITGTGSTITYTGGEGGASGQLFHDPATGAYGFTSFASTTGSSTCATATNGIATCQIAEPFDLTVVAVDGESPRNEIRLDVDPRTENPYVFPEPVTILGSARRDKISTTDLILQVRAGKGDDSIVNGVSRPSLRTPGDDIRGGKGTDLFYAYNAQAKVKVTLDNKANDGLPGEHDNIHADIEDVIAGSLGMKAVGNGADNRLLGGNQGNNVLIGRGGRDTLIAKNGDDLFDARDGRGGDTITCGGGTDTVLLDHGDHMTNSKACEHVRYTR